MPDRTEFTFVDRHIGPDADALSTMLGVIGVASLDELAAKALPAGILDAPGPDGIAPGLDGLAPPVSEHRALAELRALADSNTVAVSMIGQGYYDTLTPPVLLRNIVENPAWYTAYTPYQPEISQGRLEALLNFQTMIADLTGLEVANASMLDEGTAAAEAMTLMHRAARGSASRLAVDSDLFAQTAAILATRAEPLGIEIVTAAVGLDAHVRDADLVITGEGRIDFQTVHGKTPIGVARVAKRHGIPVIGIAGSLGADVGVVHAHGIDAVFSVLGKPCTLDEALHDAAANVELTARNVAAVLRIGLARP